MTILDLAAMNSSYLHPQGTTVLGMSAPRSNGVAEVFSGLSTLLLVVVILCFMCFTRMRRVTTFKLECQERMAHYKSTATKDNPFNISMPTSDQYHELENPFRAPDNGCRSFDAVDEGAGSIKTL
eukprot:CAMPEP_0113941112 /NCGR_PEP_ID=MMETSP1339-20121228/7111_1 /TAXON_ID=94617 /ORGANISM="Fibrocapsa japonica" /LENGTH=124 /DNA_ID=CAMNT_0000945173 /DNA_START=114 /DNA_END=488 /DNA_ORIENTATION=+ /assembly_acc=CAM_ASM_000762